MSIDFHKGDRVKTLFGAQWYRGVVKHRVRHSPSKKDQQWIRVQYNDGDVLVVDARAGDTHADHIRIGGAYQAVVPAYDPQQPVMDRGDVLVPTLDMECVHARDASLASGSVSRADTQDASLASGSVSRADTQDASLDSGSVSRADPQFDEDDASVTEASDADDLEGDHLEQSAPSSKRAKCPTHYAIGSYNFADAWFRVRILGRRRPLMSGRRRPNIKVEFICGMDGNRSVTSLPSPRLAWVYEVQTERPRVCEAGDRDASSQVRVRSRCALGWRQQRAL